MNAAPEPSPSSKGGSAGRRRYLDIEEVLGKVPAPEVRVDFGLIEILFQVGPVKGDAPLCEGDLEPWERRRGLELSPWQADTLVEMSRAYLQEMHAARQWNALPPWSKAVGMWRYVQDKRAEQERQAAEKGRELEARAAEKAKQLQGRSNNGSRKRHRNPASG